MKSKKLLTLSLLATVGLAACGGGGGNNKPKIGPWGEELEALMKEALYGEVLPYIDEFKDKEFEFEVYDGKLYIDGEATFTTADVEAYAAQFEGWEDYSEDAGYPYFAKEVEVNGVTHELDVMFALVDEEGYLAEEEPASLTIIAGDPGSWPVDTAALIMEYFESSAVLPAFENATYVEVSLDYLGFLGIAAIYVDCSEAQFEDYLDKFVEPAWTLDYDEENEQYFAISQDEKVQVDLAFEDYATIFISEYYAPVLAWPTEAVAAAVQNLVPGSEIVIPALDGCSSYEVYDYSEYDGGYITIYGTTDEDNLEGYLALFTAPAWTVSGPTGGIYSAVSSDETLEVKIWYDEDYGQIAVRVLCYVPPIVDWPTDDAAAIIEYLVPGSSTVIPAFENALGYEAYTTSLWATTEDTNSPAAYAAICEEAGWTVSGPDANGNYTAISPAQDIKLTFYYSVNYGQLAISVAKYTPPLTVWPAEAVAAYLQGVTDVVPAFTGATEYVYSGGSTVRAYVAAGTEAEAIAAYEDILDAAGYVINGQDPTDGSNRWISPNGQVIVNPYKYGTGVVGIYLYAVPQAQNEFPLEDLQEFLDLNDFGFDAVELTDPSENGFTVGTGYSQGYPYFQISVEGDVLEAWVAILDPVITAAGYELDLDESDETYYYYENDDYLTVQIFLEDGLTYVVFF